MPHHYAGGNHDPKFKLHPCISLAIGSAWAILRFPRMPEFPDDTEAWRSMDRKLVAKCLNFPNRVNAIQNAIEACIEYTMHDLEGTLDEQVSARGVEAWEIASGLRGSPDNGTLWHADLGSTTARKCSTIPVSFRSLEHGMRRTFPITEHGVKRILLITLMVVACLSIAVGKDLGSSGLGGEARGQDRDINQTEGGARSQQGSKASRGETQDQGPVRKVCQSEIERLCPGEEHAGRCLRSHSADQFSEACKAALANRGSSR